MPAPPPTALTVSNARAALGGAELAEVFRHGTLAVEFYAPAGLDRQTPHARDEVYVVASGRATFLNGPERHPVEPGQVLFVAAGAEHRFEDPSDDFATWALFYGPDGGEVGARP